MAAPNPLPATTAATDHTRCFARLVAAESEIRDTGEPAARAELRHRAARHLDAHLHGRVGPHTGGGPTVTRRLTELVATAATIVAADLRGQYGPRVNTVTVATDRLRAEYEQHGDRFEIAWHLTWPSTSTGVVAVTTVGAALDGYPGDAIGRLHDGMSDLELRDVVCHLAEMGAPLIGKRGGAVTTATDLFSGAGGSTEGLVQAGLHVEVAANHWPTAVATHSLNHPDTEHRIKDLSEIDWRTFPPTDVLWASPSCVWHARSGGRKALPVEQELRREDAGAIDRATAFAVIAAAEVHAYPVVLVENVLEFGRWVLFPWWLDGLRALGYRVQVLTLNAADHGQAQLRKRLFVVATRDGVELDLTPPQLAPVPASAIIDPDIGRPVTRRLYVTPQIDEIPADLDGVPHLVMMRKHAHARRADQHPIATVTAGGNHHMVATVVDGQPYARCLTDRERARAQGFPDSYEFTSAESGDVLKQIGNAVPVGVARWLGERTVAALAGTRQIEMELAS